ncbi:MAG: hypothetical protein R3F34_15445 [Planctomycetota bacterium]
MLEHQFFDVRDRLQGRRIRRQLRPGRVEPEVDDLVDPVGRAPDPIGELVAEAGETEGRATHGVGLLAADVDPFELEVAEALVRVPRRHPHRADLGPCTKIDRVARREDQLVAAAGSREIVHDESPELRIHDELEVVEDQDDVLAVEVLNDVPGPRGRRQPVRPASAVGVVDLAEEGRELVAHLRKPLGPGGSTRLAEEDVPAPRDESFPQSLEQGRLPDLRLAVEENDGVIAEMPLDRRDPLLLAEMAVGRARTRTGLTISREEIVEHELQIVDERVERSNEAFGLFARRGFSIADAPELRRFDLREVGEYRELALEALHRGLESPILQVVASVGHRRGSSTHDSRVIRPRVPDRVRRRAARSACRSARPAPVRENGTWPREWCRRAPRRRSARDVRASQIGLGPAGPRRSQRSAARLVPTCH